MMSFLEGSMARVARDRATSDARPEPELETGHEGNGEEAHYLFEAVEPFLRTGKRGVGARTSMKDEPGGTAGRNSGVLEQILDLVSEGAAILDANGGVNHANLALARMCGVSPNAWDEMPLEWHLNEESR